MRPEIRRTEPAAADSHWIVAAILLCGAAPLVVFAPTFTEMVETWRRSDTFAHCFLVFPAFAYLVWNQRDELRSCSVRPAPLALLGVFACGLVVTLGSLAAALTPAFFGLIGASILGVVAVLGWSVARVIWMPLLFLFFAVPFGEVFVPIMIEWTADFTVAAVRASGVPVYRQGPNFVIPSGSWSVVDACSGIRYLMASMFAGWLYAWLVYRSTWRRLAFMAASIAVPVAANWLRAYIIVMLAHLSGNKLATGVDHFIYGWVFYGIVVALMFWVGAFFRQDAGARGTFVAVKSQLVDAPPVFERRGALAAGISSLLLLAGWQFANAQLSSLVDTRPLVVQPLRAANGWEPVASPPDRWAPRLRAPAATLQQDFERQGRRVSVHVGFYRNQSQESELVNSLNDLAAQVGKSWLYIFARGLPIRLGEEDHDVNSVVGRLHTDSLVVWQWYWVDGRVLTSDSRAKASLAVKRLLARNDTSAWVALYGIDQEDGKTAETDLRQFAVDMGPSIEAAVKATVER